MPQCPRAVYNMDFPPFVSTPRAHKDRTTPWFRTQLCERDDGTIDWGWRAELYSSLLSAFQFHAQLGRPDVLCLSGFLACTGSSVRT